MKEFLDKFKTQIPDLTDLLAVVATVSICAKMLYDILNGAYAIIAFGYNNKLMSFFVIVGSLIFFIFIKRVISLTINIVINKLFRRSTPTSEEDYSKNQNVGQLASTVSSYVNLLASLITLFGVVKTFSKSADKNTAVVQDVAGYVQYVKNFTLEDKKEWYESIITDYKLNINDNFWTSLTKEIPWDLINTKLQLLNFLEIKVRLFKEQKIAELLKAQEDLQEQINNSNSIMNKILTLIDALIKNILSFIYYHPYVAGTLIITLGSLLWFLIMHKQDLISEGFQKTSEVIDKMTDYTDKIKDSFTERLQQLYNHQLEVKESIKRLANGLNTVTNELINWKGEYMKNNPSFSIVKVIQDEINTLITENKLLKLQIEELQQLNDVILQALAENTDQITQVITTIAENTTNN